MVQNILTEVHNDEPLLNTLGRLSEFDFTSDLLTSDVAELKTSNPVLISNDCIVQVADLYNKNDGSNVTGVFLSKSVDGDEAPVGYVVYTWSKEFPNTVVVCINRFKTRAFKSLNTGLHGIINPVVEKSNPFDALKIEPEFQNKGHGKALWLLGATYLESRGVEQVIIEGDLTIAKETAGTSFYTSMGAEISKDGREIYPTKKVWEQKDYIQSLISLK